MSKLPLLDKNAYLSIYIKENAIYSHLAYSHYDIGRTYIVGDEAQLPDLGMYSHDFAISRDEMVPLWWNLFEGLEKVLDWQIVDKNGLKDDPIFSIASFSDEGVGVTGISIKVDKANVYVNDFLSSIRILSPYISIKVVDSGYKEQLLSDVAEKLGYEDVIWLDLGLFDFVVRRAVKSGKNPTLAAPKDKKYVYSSNGIHWDSRRSLIESIKSSKLKAFLSMELAKNKLENSWANFVSDPTLATSSLPLQDLLRSYISIQILSIFNDNKARLANFGVNKAKSAVVVTGEIAKLIPVKFLLVSIIDGLQIRGSFDFYNDSKYKFMAYGNNMALGINSKEIIVNRDDVMGLPSKVFVIDTEGKYGNRKVVLTGRVGAEHAESIFAVSPEINENLLSQTGKYVVDAQLLHGARIEGIGNKLKLEVDTEKTRFKSIIFDARYKPVVYGPEPKKNKIKLNEWGVV